MELTRCTRSCFARLFFVPNLVEEKSYLVVFSSEEHYQIDAERGPPETQARDSSPVIYN